jgi:hypothetical protein
VLGGYTKASDVYTGTTISIIIIIIAFEIIVCGVSQCPFKAGM